MAFIFIQGGVAAIDSGQFQTTLTVTLGAAVTAGNLLVAFAISGFPNQRTCTGVVEGSDTFVKIDEFVKTNDTATSWYAKNCVGGNTAVVFTFSGQPTDFERVWVAEFSGGDTVAPLDTHWIGRIATDGGTFDNTGTTDGCSTANITPTANGVLLVAAGFQGNEQNDFAAGTGWTGPASLRNSNGAGDDGRMIYKEQATAAAVAGLWTYTGGAGSADTFIAAFKLPGGAADTYLISRRRQTFFRAAQ